MQWFSILLLTLLLTVSGCNVQFESSKAPTSTHIYKEKQVPSHQFFMTDKIKPLHAGSGSVKAVEWYNDSEVIVLANVQGVSTLQAYHLYSGNKSRFFETTNPIVTVEANYDYSYFAIQVLHNNYNHSIFIVDRDGNLVKRWDTVANEVYFQWNPHNNEELLVVSLLPNWAFEAVHFNIKDPTFNKIQAGNPSLDWLMDDAVVYLDWDQSVNNSSAPLQILNLKTQEVSKIKEDVEAFFTFKESLLTISHSKENKSTLKYSFYDIASLNKLSELSIPSINTYSEQLWISNHEYVDKRKLFYLIKPIIAEDQISSYQLIEFDVLNGTQREVAALDEHVPILCSPEGDICLEGKRLEDIINMKSGKIYPFIK